MKNNTYLNKKSKKAQVTTLNALVTILVAVVIILLSTQLLTANTEQLVTSAQDVACRAYLQSFDSVGRVVSATQQFNEEQRFFGQISQYCRTERLIFDETDQEYVFNRLSQASRRCNERYGAGELDFLAFSQREGSYCFVCAEIEFIRDDDQETSFRYTDLANFMEQTIARDRNPEGKNYRELSNLFYVNVNGGKNSILRGQESITALESALIRDESRLALIGISDQFNYLMNIYQRELLTSQKTFVVYRYNVDGKSDILAGAQLQGTTLRAAATGYGQKRIACFAKTAAASTLTSLFPPAAVAIGVVGTTICAGSAALGAAGMAISAADQQSLSLHYPNIMGIFQFPGSYEQIPESDLRIIDNLNQKLENPSSLSFNDLESISQRVINRLNIEEMRIYERLEDGQTINEEELLSFITSLLRNQVQVTLSGIETFDFEQYVEILPESDFYRECGIVPNVNMR